MGSLYLNRYLLAYIVLMSEHPPERLNSDVIRQGLLSIRNSQIELLNELKNETQQLKKTPIRFATSTEDSKTTDHQSKIDTFNFPTENAESIVRFNPPSPSPIEKPFSFGFSNQKQIEAEVTYLKDENKMLNETLQKLLYSRSLDKQRVRELESYLYFSSKIHLQLFNQILNGTPISDVRKTFENDLRLNEDVYSKYQESNHQLILQLLQEKEADHQPFRMGTSPHNPKEAEIASQLSELKQQLVILMKSNQQKNETKANVDQENARIKQHNDILMRKCEQLQRRIGKLESDNKQLALCWEREINERKAVTGQIQRIKRDTGLNTDRERQIGFIQKDMELKLNNAHKALREKEVAEANHAQTIKKLSDTISLLKEENQRLKRQIKSIEELRATLQRDDMATSRIRENEMMAKINQQAHVLKNYEKEIFDLRAHLAESQRNMEVMAQMHAKQREAEASNQELYMKKVQAIKTNSTVEHLWQVKRVEYDNINELLLELKEKSRRL